MQKSFAGLICALGLLAAQGAVVYQLPEAIELNGSQSGPTVPANVLPEYPAGFTIAAWIRPTQLDGVNNGCREIYRMETGNTRVLFSFQDNGKILAFGLATTSSSYSELEVYDAGLPAYMTDGGWHYVCAVFGRGYRAIWIDGVKRVEQAYSVRVGRNTVGYVGSSGGTGEFFKGGIADLQILDEELMPADLSANFVNGLATLGQVWVWNGAAGAAWTTAANWLQDEVTATNVPNAYAVVEMTAPASAALAADAHLGAILRVKGTGTVGLSGVYTNEIVRGEFASGVVLDLPEGAEVRAKNLIRGTETVFPGIYTGSGDTGTQVPWLSGKGIVRVAQPRTGTYPTVIPVAGNDGWYEFGQATGYAMGEMGGSALASGNRQYLRGERVVFDTLALPSNANVRLVGGLAADRIPCDTIGQLDVTKLRKFMAQEAPAAFADGSPFTLPVSCDMYYTPGTLAYHAASNCWYYASVLSQPYDAPLQVKGTLHICGNGNTVNPRTFKGALSGTGTIKVTNFGNAARVSAPFTFTGDLTAFQEGCPFWIDTTCVSGKVGTVALSRAEYGGGLQASYAANGLLFGKDGSDATADNPLCVNYLIGNAWIKVDAKGHTWRQGGSVIVWGGNTVHLGTLEKGLHVVASRTEQDCNGSLYAQSYKSKGLGNLIVDMFKSGTLYGSTNVNVQIGNVTAGDVQAVDYTLQENGVNARTLAFTGTCSSVSVAATDLAMLPARLTGFQGTVNLTNTLAKAYVMPIDFAQGPNGLYNPVGCAGSGTLVAAPASGSIDVQFDATHAGAKPEKGAYALARFTAGGERLSGWTVTLNGTSATSVPVRGMTVELKRDATGLWLDVRKTGLGVIIR